MNKYFVIGNPVEHSLSPKLHNFWIKKNNINAFYDKKKLEENEIENFIENIKRNVITGSNVTVPFKKTVIPYLDKLSPEAELTQSVNTIISQNNRLVGYNTDIVGFSKAIEQTNFSVKNKKIFILGAGGVVPSIIFSLKRMQVSEIIISNRTREKAQNLKNYFDDLKIINWGEVPTFDMVINATSLGLKNESIELDFSDIGKDKLFYDVIYNPSETKFLKKGRELGHRTQNGKLMFIYQAHESFKLWHNIDPLIDEETLKLFEND